MGLSASPKTSTAVSSAAASMATATSSAAAGSAFFARTGLVNLEGTPANFLPVESFDCGVGLVVVIHGDEPEAPRASGFAIRDQVYPFHGTIFTEELFKLRSVDTVGKISHVDVHYFSFSNKRASFENGSMERRAPENHFEFGNGST